MTEPLERIAVALEELAGFQRETLEWARADRAHYEELRARAEAEGALRVALADVQVPAEPDPSAELLRLAVIAFRRLAGEDDPPA